MEAIEGDGGDAYLTPLNMVDINAPAPADTNKEPAP